MDEHNETSVNTISDYLIELSKQVDNGFIKTEGQYHTSSGGTVFFLVYIQHEKCPWNLAGVIGGRVDHDEFISSQYYSNAKWNPLDMTSDQEIINTFEQIKESNKNYWI